MGHASKGFETAHLLIVGMDRLSLRPSLESKATAMSRAPSNFRQRDLERALKAAKAAGWDVQRIAVENGRITLETTEVCAGRSVRGDSSNEWDDVE